MLHSANHGKTNKIKHIKKLYCWKIFFQQSQSDFQNPKNRKQYKYAVKPNERVKMNELAPLRRDSLGVNAFVGWASYHFSKTEWSDSILLLVWSNRTFIICCRTVLSYHALVSNLLIQSRRNSAWQHEQLLIARPKRPSSVY